MLIEACLPENVLYPVHQDIKQLIWVVRVTVKCLADRQCELQSHLWLEDEQAGHLGEYCHPQLIVYCAFLLYECVQILLALL